MPRERLNVWGGFSSSIIGTQEVGIIELGLEYSGIRREKAVTNESMLLAGIKKRKAGCFCRGENLDGRIS